MPRVDTNTLRRLLEKPAKVGLESICVESLDYDLPTETLTIVFRARGTYEYTQVPLDVYVDLAGAESQGRYFNLYIREKYNTRRVA
jgi:hypothetical protein